MVGAHGWLPAYREGSGNCTSRPASTVVASPRSPMPTLRRLPNRDHAIISQFIITRRDKEPGNYDYGALAAQSTPAQHSARLTFSKPNAKASGSANPWLRPPPTPCLRSGLGAK
ncbi:hypothetical protein S40285_10274 [Stachybotrys chlorohalonatus IBT 40285]|uniref:Uncharacterized protein n=1 Tax=Stachybotrys chlorohalonatus (strain IBT 40285) TaxID=1283841 RepID=A0A084Q9S1_STAC4|nr:hypothetical protein S40285_10274 [Stachybotrys chlorohalonata IBT 40285]